MKYVKILRPNLILIRNIKDHDNSENHESSNEYMQVSIVEEKQGTTKIHSAQKKQQY